MSIISLNCLLFSVVVVVGISLVLVVVLLGLAKWFYHKRGSWKEPIRPQTPR